MGIAEDLIGRGAPPNAFTVERGRLQFFAKATGQLDRRYYDVDAARRSGFPDLPVPPTFYFTMLLEPQGLLEVLSEAGADPSAILHGGQVFEYHRMAFAGEALTSKWSVVDVRDKGLLQIITIRGSVTSEDDGPVVDLVTTLLLQTPKESAA